jgi:hypothetical protein
VDRLVQHRKDSGGDKTHAQSVTMGPKYAVCRTAGLILNCFMLCYVTVNVNICVMYTFTKWTGKAHGIVD